MDRGAWQAPWVTELDMTEQLTDIQGYPKRWFQAVLSKPSKVRNPYFPSPTPSWTDPLVQYNSNTS